MDEVRVKPAAFWEELRRGKRVPKSLHQCRIKTTFPHAEAGGVRKVVCMSDMHGAAPQVVDKLVRTVIDRDTIVICTGDMAGDGRMGGDGDPAPEYRRLRNAAQALYLVQGNHDVYSSEVLQLRNDDGSWCCVDQRAADGPLGRIAGVSGIMVPEGREDARCHRYTRDEYMRRLARCLQTKPDILLTHTPLSDVQHGVAHHFFGHAPIEPYINVGGSGDLRLCMDGRIFVFE